MKIAMLGQKGTPAHSGGVEQHVDVLSRHLVERGHEVVVYCRRSYCGKDARSERRGSLHRVMRASIPTKHLDTITHTLLSTLDVGLRRADVVHYHAIGPAALAPLARLARLPVVVTVHGLDWQRAKWGRFARRCLQLGERTATFASNRLVVVSPVLREYFARKHRVEADYIPNAVIPMDRVPADRILSFGIRPGQYVLAASRLVPEKGVHYLIDAFRQTAHDVQLVIAGGGDLDPSYERQLRRCNDPRIIFTGPADRKMMAELYCHAMLFTLPSDLEGMPIGLLEAMHMRLPVLVSDIPENTCVVEDAGFQFQAGNVDRLREQLNRILSRQDELPEWGARSAAQVEPFQWPLVVDQLEEVYRQCVARNRPRAKARVSGPRAPLSPRFEQPQKSKRQTIKQPL